MALIRALAFLRVRSAKNRIVSRLRRFRQPKYLVGGIVGGLYLWFFFLRNVFGGHFGGGRGGGSGAPFDFAPELQAAGEVVGAWGLILFMAAFWLVPTRRAALDFTEAEVQFLFPAPISRIGLLHYKLASWQVGLMGTSLIMSLFSGRLLRGDGAWMAVIGWWLVLLLLQLHSLAASFVRTWLLDRGVSHWKRRWIVAVVLGGTVLGAVLWGGLEAPAPPQDWGDLETLANWWMALSATTPMAELLAPWRWVVRMAITRDAAEFARLAGPVVLLVALHYFWVVRATVAFEEASVEAARAAVAQAPRPGVPGSGRVGRPGVDRDRLLFPLNPIGPPWVALGWKNLAAAGDWFRGRLMIVTVPVLLVAIVLGSALARGTAVAMVVGATAAMLLGLTILVGPSNARMDLRQDLGSSGWTVLRALPLTGREIVLGALLAPWCALTALQWGLGLAVVTFLEAPEEMGPVGLWERGVAWLALASLGPSVSLLGICLQNAGALIFPAWVLPPAGQTRGGFEVLGQRLIVYTAQMLVLLLALLPAVVVGAVGYMGAAWMLGNWAGVAVASVLAAGVLGFESAMGIRALGWIWDRTDLSRERTG